MLEVIKLQMNKSNQVVSETPAYRTEHTKGEKTNHLPSKILWTVCYRSAKWTWQQAFQHLYGRIKLAGSSSFLISYTYKEKTFKRAAGETFCAAANQCSALFASARKGSVWTAINDDGSILLRSRPSVLGLLIPGWRMVCHRRILRRGTLLHRRHALAPEQASCLA
jgi:hypothetical protein